jgi:hypothetical protein
VLLAILAIIIVGIWRWMGQSPRRERIAAWSALRAITYSAAAIGLAVLLDPDHGIVKQGGHMWFVGPVDWMLILAGTTLFARWIHLRNTSASVDERKPT